MAELVDGLDSKFHHKSLVVLVSAKTLDKMKEHAKCSGMNHTPSRRKTGTLISARSKAGDSSSITEVLTSQSESCLVAV